MAGAKRDDVAAGVDVLGVKRGAVEAGIFSLAKGFTFSFSGSGSVCFAVCSCAGSFAANAADGVPELEKENAGDGVASFCASVLKGLKDGAADDWAGLPNGEGLNALLRLLLCVPFDSSIMSMEDVAGFLLEVEPVGEDSFVSFRCLLCNLLKAFGGRRLAMGRFFDSSCELLLQVYICLKTPMGPFFLKD